MKKFFSNLFNSIEVKKIKIGQVLVIFGVLFLIWFALDVLSMYGRIIRGEIE